MINFGNNITATASAIFSNASVESANTLAMNLLQQIGQVYAGANPVQEFLNHAFDALQESISNTYGIVVIVAGVTALSFYSIWQHAQKAKVTTKEIKVPAPTITELLQKTESLCDLISVGGPDPVQEEQRKKLLQQSGLESNQEPRITTIRKNLKSLFENIAVDLNTLNTARSDIEILPDKLKRPELDKISNLIKEALEKKSLSGNLQEISRQFDDFVSRIKTIEQLTPGQGMSRV